MGLGRWDLQNNCFQDDQLPSNLVSGIETEHDNNDDDHAPSLDEMEYSDEEVLEDDWPTEY